MIRSVLKGRSVFAVGLCLLALTWASAAMADSNDNDVVFDVDIIKCGLPGPSACGSNLPATDPLDDGRVRVTADGRVHVELDDAAPNAIYDVYVGNWVTGGGFQWQFGSPSFVGRVTTDGDGDYDGLVKTLGGGNFVFPALTKIGQPNFAFNNGGATQFTTGFSTSHFDVDVIRCGLAFAPDGCGSNGPATNPLRNGNVRLTSNGKVRVSLRGAAPSTIYQVFVGNWVTGGAFQPQHPAGPAVSIGTITTNSSGNFEGNVQSAPFVDFVFPPATSIGQPNFAFNNGPTQFTTGFSVPLPERTLFEVDIIRCGGPGAPDGCGLNFAASDPLERGKLKVNNRGRVRVTLRGAAPNAIYRVFVGNWVITSGSFQFQFDGAELSDSIGTVPTDVNGDYEGPVLLTGGAPFVFPLGTEIGQANFAFNNEAVVGTQFTTGFEIPLVLP